MDASNVFKVFFSSSNGNCVDFAPKRSNLFYNVLSSIYLIRSQQGHIGMKISRQKNYVIRNQMIVECASFPLTNSEPLSV